MKFLRGLLRLIFEKIKRKLFMNLFSEEKPFSYLSGVSTAIAEEIN